MSKEYLEALNDLFDLVHCQDSFEKAQKYFDIIEQALQRLEVIDNANPSEAWKIVYNNFDYLISDVCIENDDVNICLKTIKEQLPTIKQALLKAQEEHKALEIIKEKCLTNCNLALVKDNLHYQNYCNEFEYFLNKYNESPNGFEITKEDLLTEEEFNLLKEVLE